MALDVVLAKAEFETFLKHYTVYKVLRNNNRFNLGEESIRLSIHDDREFCRFIYCDGKRAGGVILRHNAIKHLFLYPDYQPFLMEVIKALHGKVMTTVERGQGISCLPSDSYQAVNFGKIGYKTVRKMQCMVGPLNKVSWKTPSGFGFRRPSAGDMEQIVKLVYDANVDEPWHQPVTIERFRRGAELYFDNTKSTALPEASSLCIDEETGRAVGICLVSIDEAFPFIYDLHVLKEYRRLGIATNMIKKAMSKTVNENDFIRLFVIDGNPAKKLYDNLGFIAGNPVYIMKYPND